MWLVLNKSFVSVVQDHEDPTMLWVRARSKKCLAALFGKGQKIQTSTNTDYSYRVKIDRIEFSRMVANLALTDIDYTNFKDSIPDKDNLRYHAYTKVWSVMVEFRYPGDVPSIYSRT